jgi:hypothetical protein
LRDAPPNSRRFVSLTNALFGDPTETAFDGLLPIRRHVKAKVSRQNIGVFTGLDARLSSLTAFTLSDMQAHTL